MREIVKDYLWTFEFADIDNGKLYDTCCNVEEQLKSKFPAIVGNNAYGCFTSYYHEQYNLLQYNCPELHKLYSNMVKSFRQVMDNRQYYVRCWVNLFDKNKNIDWHSHWNPEQETYHGFYCVNTEGEHKSYTDYRIPGYEDTYRIVSHNGLCVYGKSDGDKHRSSEWLNDDKYRVTIAFDIIPVETLKGELDNFIPLARLPQ